MAGRIRPTMTEEEREAAAAALRANGGAPTDTTLVPKTSTPSSIASGIDYGTTGTKYNSGNYVTPTDVRKNPTNDEVTVPDTGIPGDLLTSLRRGILTGAQVQGGARTFRGGGAFSSAFKKGASSLRIGKTRLDQQRSKEIKRRKQTNTLGLNLGSSVGLQV